jgi:dTDP-4-dehydrorhamnose reductase
MKILLTGRNGQLGSEMYRSLSTQGKVYAFNSGELNLAEPRKIVDVIHDIKPDIIINTAAYTAVDKAELEPLYANNINHLAPSIMAREAEKIGSTIIHFSTDYVYDGTKQGAYVESDPTNPLNIYGRTKLAGDIAVSNMCSRHLILRTSWVHGAYGHNFIKTIFRLAHEKQEINVVIDQRGIPTSATFLADTTINLLIQAHKKPESFPYGIYNLTALGNTSWYEYARFIIQECLDRGLPLKLPVDGIKSIKTIDYKTQATRPLNSCLDSSKFRDTFNLHLPEWEKGVRHTLNQFITS